MVTKIDVWRNELITKEAMEKFCKGEEDEKDSVNDDLESLFEDLRLGKESNEEVLTYFLPKLTKRELDLVKRKNKNYLQSFERSLNPDVEEAQMNQSESDSKFVKGWGWRSTITYENPSENLEFHPASAIQSSVNLRTDRKRKHSSTE